MIMMTFYSFAFFSSWQNISEDSQQKVYKIKQNESELS